MSSTSGSGRYYQIYDVFTARSLAGNPLAVVHEGEGLEPARMQAIARQFNLSETVFVMPAASGIHSAAIRIFTPRHELPFAGHPTVGTAIALAARAGNGDSAIIVLEEQIGDVRCVVSRIDGTAFAEFDLPRLPQSLPLVAEVETIGAALGLGPQDICFENHRPSLWSAGVPYLCVPVRGLDAAARARLNPSLWEEVAPETGGIAASAYVYCRETVHHDCAFHARMFTAGEGSFEDPATGSALAAFAGAVHHFDGSGDGAHGIWVEQGIEMGRTSRLRLETEVEAGAIRAARIGGHAVLTAEGRIFV